MGASSTSPTRSGGAGTSGAAQLTKLTPYDGLFLRAEHLSALETYAEQVAAAVGRAGGSGVVHGLTVRLDSNRLVVDPGLAIDGSGLPLVVDQGLEIPLEELKHADTTRVGLGQICLLELVAKEMPTGDGGGFADMCADPCPAGVAASRPYAIRTATHRLAAPRQVDIGASIPSEQFRSRVAAAWFETEAAIPSLVPTRGPAVNPWCAPDWRTGTPLPEAAKDGAVPLALLLKVDSSAGWEVDLWVARRDRIDTPPWTCGNTAWAVDRARSSLPRYCSSRSSSARWRWVSPRRPCRRPSSSRPSKTRSRVSGGRRTGSESSRR